MKYMESLEIRPQIEDRAQQWELCSVLWFVSGLVIAGKYFCGIDSIIGKGLNTASKVRFQTTVF